MPNQIIDRNLSQALQNAFGGSPTPAVSQQTPPPAAPSTGGSAAGPSLWQSLISALRPQSNPSASPYDNFANKATGRDYK